MNYGRTIGYETPLVLIFIQNLPDASSILIVLKLFKVFWGEGLSFLCSFLAPFYL